MAQAFTEAWVLHRGESAGILGELVRESFCFDELEPAEVFARLLNGCWEGNMDHSVRRSPVDICELRGEAKVVIGNAGVGGVIRTGSAALSLRDVERHALPRQTSVFVHDCCRMRDVAIRILYDDAAPFNVGQGDVMVPFGIVERALRTTLLMSMQAVRWLHLKDVSWSRQYVRQPCGLGSLIAAWRESNGVLRFDERRHATLIVEPLHLVLV